eukprot:scaffold3756_cov116-Skeletonema_dohrnii-CCMP3373.AAC.2
MAVAAQHEQDEHWPSGFSEIMSLPCSISGWWRESSLWSTAMLAWSGGGVWTVAVRCNGGLLTTSSWHQGIANDEFESGGTRTSL